MRFAHSKSKGGYPEPVDRHLLAVAAKTEEFASYWGGGEEGYAAGLLHDLGKYSTRFQKVLQKQDQGVDHWTPGAWVALDEWKRDGINVAMAIQGHHQGLQSGEKRELARSIDLNRVRRPDERSLPEESIGELKGFMQADGLELPSKLGSYGASCYAQSVTSGLHARMLFSALVDADYLCTEAHFQAKRPNELAFRPAGMELHPEKQWRALFKHLSDIKKGSKSSSELQAVRDDLFNACVNAAQAPPGLFTLTAPTGSGKTLATLAFALKHAIRNNLRRIIVILPFLSILDQTADTYRNVLNAYAQFMLEDHSLVDATAGSEAEKARFLVDNWDAPLIVTTTVKFFDSLFSAHPGTCRKLHRLAGSVIIFDEAQTMPLSLAIPTLGALASLAEYYNSTVLFSTATQPAFTALNIKANGFTDLSWQPVEIAAPELKLFERLRRVRATFWPERLTLQSLADRLASSQRALAVVNTKKQARILHGYLAEKGMEGLFHLSTDMCPAHRRALIKDVKERLAVNGADVYLASTQCIEAGVDIDFPELWRALAPWDSLVQSAGRCNREGTLDLGQFYVFIPDASEEAYPSSEYERASKLVLELIGDDWDMLFDQAKTYEYFQRLYARVDANDKRTKELVDAIRSRNMTEIEQKYAWIDKTAMYNILVPYQPMLAQYERLAEAGLNGWVNGDWFRQARELSVSTNLSRAQLESGWLAPISLKGEEVHGWRVLIDPIAYSAETGLLLENLTERVLTTTC